MYKVWCSYLSKRKETIKLIAPVLGIMSLSGSDVDVLNVGFFNNYQEQYLIFQDRFNDWARVIKDTRRSAAYAVSSEKRLEAYTYSHSTARCDSHGAFTVLHTYLGSKFLLFCLPHQ